MLQSDRILKKQLFSTKSKAYTLTWFEVLVSGSQVFVYPGMPFFPGQKGYDALRINFSHTPEAIDRGMAVLGKLLKQHLTNTFFN